MKKTKIVATVGPACSKKQMLEDLVEAGVNVFRLNFSHGCYEDHLKVVKNIRFVERKLKKRIGILADIQGPRIRICNRKELRLAEGDKVVLTDERSECSHNYKSELILDWNAFYENLGIGKVVFIEDGLIQLKTVKKISGGIVAEVIVPGLVKPRKGVNIPSISHHMGFLTDKDLADLKFILSQEIDFLGVSFVGTGENLKDLRRIIDYNLNANVKQKFYREKLENDGTPWIISKIERTSAIDNLKDIIRYSDGVMIARGDLAIEEPQEKVTIYQKDIISMCRKNKKPVIVATQMMSSMTESARPTRAEISDVTNAVIDGTDAVMLSNESAVGKFPEETVSTMNKIIVAAEESPYNDVAFSKRSKVARLFDSLKNKSKKKSSGVVEADSLDEAIAFSALRQEDVRLSFKTKNAFHKRKSAILWGVEV